MKKKWYRIDERENAIDFLEFAARARVGRGKHKWKWVTISLHGALYSFAVLAITGTVPERVMRGTKLINLHDALRRCQTDSYMLQFSHSKRLVMNEEEAKSVSRLSEGFRNNFEHFTPKFWSIEIAAVSEILKDVCRIVEFLVFDSGNVRLTEWQRTRVLSSLKKIRGH